MTARERQLIRFLLALFVTALAVGWLVKQAQQPVPEGDPDLVPVGIAATLLPGDWLCPEMVTIAASVGWPASELATLDMVMHRESRCLPDVHAGPEDGPVFARDDSYGLLQINVKGDLWAARQAVCGLSRRDTLFIPAVNLTCGLRLWEQSGWSPWGL